MIILALLQFPVAAKPDPEMVRLLQAWSSLGGRPLHSLTPQRARSQPDLASAVEVLRRKHTNIDPVQAVAKVTDTTLPGPAGDLPARVYQPAGDGPFPVLVYFHGGGFVVGSIKSADASARALANSAGCVVISVGYRQAPEHPYPAALKDAYAAFNYVSRSAKEFQGDPNRIAIGGEHSGANLAAAVCIMAYDQKRRMPIHQLLIGPITSLDFETASYRSNATAQPHGRADMEWFMKQYLSRAKDRQSPYVNILRRASTDLPPATVIVAELDPLRSDGEAYHERLVSRGCESVLRTYQGVTADFFGARAVVTKAKQANDFAGGRLRKAFTVRKGYRVGPRPTSSPTAQPSP